MAESTKTTTTKTSSKAKTTSKSKAKPKPKAVLDAKTKTISVEGNDVPIKKAVLTDAKRVLDWVFELNKKEGVSDEAVTSFVTLVNDNLFEGQAQKKIC